MTKGDIVRFQHYPTGTIRVGVYVRDFAEYRSIGVRTATGEVVVHLSNVVRP